MAVRAGSCEVPVKVEAYLLATWMWVGVQLKPVVLYVAAECNEQVLETFGTAHYNAL